MLWATSSASAWLPLAAVAAAAWIVFRLHRKLAAWHNGGQRQPHDSAGQGTHAPARTTCGSQAAAARGGTLPAGLRSAAGELAAWEVAMHETARDLKAELDTRIALVQQWVRAADEAIARLQAVLERLEAAAPGPPDGPTQQTPAAQRP
jgi:hypothetical protein